MRDDAKTVKFLNFNVSEDNLCLEDYLMLDSVGNRRFDAVGEITEETVSYIVPWIYRFNEIDNKNNKAISEREPIRLLICSVGGSVFDGFSIIDAMEQSKTPIYTYNIGYCFSMAFHIFISGHKRFALPNSVFLHHDGSDCMIGSTLKNQDYAEFSQLYRDRVITQNVLRHTKITKEQLIQNERREWYMCTEEAKALGVFDEYIHG